MPRDDAELEVEPFAVFVLGVAGREAGGGQAVRQAGLGGLLRNSVASSTAVPPSPTEKRGRIG